MPSKAMNNNNARMNTRSDRMPSRPSSPLSSTPTTFVRSTLLSVLWICSVLTPKSANLSRPSLRRLVISSEYCGRIVAN